MEKKQKNTPAANSAEIPDEKPEFNIFTNSWNAPNNLYKLQIKEFDFGIKPSELFLVIDSLIDKKGLASHHLESANNLYKYGIEQIITQGFNVTKDIENKRTATQEDKDIDWIRAEVHFTKVNLNPPTTVHYKTNKATVLYPKVALVREKVYSGVLTVNCEIKATAHLKNGSTIERTESVQNFKICKVPIIKGSIMCNTYGKSAEALEKLGEDPADPGGQFLIQGNEYVAEMTENIVMNQAKIYKNKGYGNSLVRCEFISKPGDNYQNSDMLLITYYNNDNIMIEISRNEFKGVRLPFYLLFRAMGWTTDHEIFSNIVLSYTMESNIDILNLLIRSIEAKYNTFNARYANSQVEALKQIINALPPERYAHLDLAHNPEKYQQANCDVLKIFDLYCLGHIGTTAECRHEKLRFLALLIRKVLQCHLDQIPETNRDSYRNKRIYAAGDNYAKKLKTFFNQTGVLPIKRRMLKDFQSSSFSQVNLRNLVESAIYADDFERLIVKTINVGNRATMQLKKKNLTNTLSTQPLGRRNQIDTFSTLRQVTTTSADSANKSSRAAKMRYVPMSALGYICCIHSPPEGETVGINKQLAISAIMAPTSSSEVLKNIIRDDNLLLPLKNLKPAEIAENNLSNVYVNGDWLGCVKNSCDFVRKYRKMRRNLEIHPHTTIYWDPTMDEVLFWVDVGRLTRPLIIVYNNQRDPDIVQLANKTKNKHESKNNNIEDFEQGIAITRADIQDLYTQRKSIDDLVREKKVEFITPEEQENCYLCPSFERLMEERNNPLKEYTHCDIPQALLALTSLTSPFAHHNQTTRLTYQTAQVKQTCGYYALNWTYRVDKETFLQYVNEKPLISTVANKYLFPSGVNIMLAILCAEYNQEDSIIMNKAAVERGVFWGCKMTFYRTDLEQKEELDNPESSKTADLKSANYEKLVNGIVPKGSIIKTDDVIIGKYMNVQKNKNEKLTQVDRSIIYRDREDAHVHSVITGRDEEDNPFVKVGLRKEREVKIGDKFCVPVDAEILTECGFKRLANININVDKIATYQNGQLIFVYAKSRPIFALGDEKIINYHDRDNGVYVRMTEMHRCYVYNSHMQNYEFILAKDLYKMEEDELSKYSFCTSTLLTNQKSKKPNKHVINRTLPESYLYLLAYYLINGEVRADGKITLRIYNKYEDKLINYVKGMAYEYTSDLDTDDPYIIIDCLELFLPAHYTNSIQKLNGKITHECVKNLNKNKRVPQSIFLLDHHTIEKFVNMCFDVSGDREKIYTSCLSNYRLTRDIEQLTYLTGNQVTFDSDAYFSTETESMNLIKNKLIPIHKEYFTSTHICRTTYYSSYFKDLYNSVVPEIDGNRPDSQFLVGCLEIPETQIFYMRMDNTHVGMWSGNSARSGQKGICAMLMPEEDLPYTKEGIRPTLLFNSHGIPSRMTVSTYLEILVGNLCAARGMSADATIFNKNDIESIADQLESYGLHRYGYERMMSGETGEYIDALIYFGPTPYQRLHKFVADQEYSVRHAVSDAITLQPVEGGRGSGGGLRIGEMEKDVYFSHGTAMAFHEKFYSHSDGYTEYRCRCGKPAIVNHQERIYKCNYCKDNADIYAHPTSWASKLFMQELESTGVGVRMIPQPFKYEVFDTEGTESRIEVADPSVAKKIELQNEVMDFSNADYEDGAGVDGTDADWE